MRFLNETSFAKDNKLYRKARSVRQTGLVKVERCLALEAKRGAQVYGAVPSWSARHTKCLAEDVCVGETPPGVIQHIVEAGKSLQASLLQNRESFCYRKVPNKSISV